MPFTSFKSQPAAQPSATGAGGNSTDQRRQSWDYAEAHAPGYQATATTATATAQELPAAAGAKQRRPSWVERHLLLGDEDARRALGM